MKEQYLQHNLLPFKEKSIMHIMFNIHSNILYRYLYKSYPMTFNKCVLKIKIRYNPIIYQALFVRERR